MCRHGFAIRDDSAGRLDFERLRAGRNAAQRGRRRATGDALPSFLGQVVTSGASLSAGQFCKVVPRPCSGPSRRGGRELRGGGLRRDVATPVFVYLMGSFVPSDGRLPGLPVRRPPLGGRDDGRRDVARDGGLPPVLLLLGPRDAPDDLGRPDCNYQMFQSCTLQYGPPPPAMAILGYTPTSSPARIVRRPDHRVELLLLLLVPVQPVLPLAHLPDIAAGYALSRRDPV